MWRPLILLVFMPAALAITPDAPTVLCNRTICGNCTETPAGLNYARYAPTARVTRYSNLDRSKGHAFPNVSDISSFIKTEDILNSETYLHAIVFSLVETVGFAFVMFFTFAIWSLFRCCNYCSCGVGCHSANPTSGCRWISRIVLFVLLGGAGALAYVSTDTAKAFNDGIGSISDSFAFTSDWITGINTNAEIVLAAASKVELLADDLNTKLNSSSVLPPQAKDVAIGMVDTIQAAVGSIKGEAGGLGTLLQPLSGPIDQVEKMVALGPEYLDDNLAYALYGTCGLFGLLVLSVLLCTCPPKVCSPAPTACRLLLDCGIFGFVWIILVIWIVSLMLQLISSFLADICQDPDTVVLGLLGGNKMAEYYITCAGASPFAEAVATIDTDFTSASDELLLLKSYSTVGSVAGVEIDALQDGMNVLKTALLVNDNDDNAVCGLFHETDCTVVNARYQALINGICGGFMEPLSRIFETFISFAAALSILEFLRRLVSGTEHELPGESGDGSDDDDDEYGIEMGKKYSRNKKIPTSPLGAMMAKNKATDNEPTTKAKKKGKKGKNNNKKKKKKKKKKEENWDDYGDEDYDAYGDMDEDDGWAEMDGDEALKHRNSWTDRDNYDEGDWDNGGGDSYGGGGNRETHFSPGIQGRDTPSYSNNKSYY